MRSKKYNTRKIRTFLLFLALACVIWILTKFSKDYTATMNANLFYTDIPQSAVLSDSNEKELSFDVTANGFTFLQYQIKKPELHLSLKDYVPDENEQIVLTQTDLTRLINDELGIDISVANLSPSELVIRFDQLASRTIPVQPNVEVQFREGYKSVKGIELSPDSILVSAPEDLIDQITSISSQEMALNDVHETVNLELKLLSPDVDGVLINPSEVTLTLRVTEFTQKTISIPVSVQNVPAETTVKIIPEQIDVTFDVAMEEFNAISAADFSLVCNYDERNTEDNFMLVSVEKKPDGVLNVELAEKKVDYLIFN